METNKIDELELEGDKEHTDEDEDEDNHAVGCSDNALAQLFCMKRNIIQDVPLSSVVVEVIGGLKGYQGNLLYQWDVYVVRDDGSNTVWVLVWYCTTQEEHLQLHKAPVSFYQILRIVQYK